MGIDSTFFYGANGIIDNRSILLSPAVESGSDPSDSTRLTNCEGSSLGEDDDVERKRI